MRIKKLALLLLVSYFPLLAGGVSFVPSLLPTSFRPLFFMILLNRWCTFFHFNSHHTFHNSLIRDHRRSMRRPGHIVRRVLQSYDIKKILARKKKSRFLRCCAVSLSLLLINEHFFWGSFSSCWPETPFYVRTYLFFHKYR